MSAIAIVGDVHGGLSQLDEAFEWLNDNWSGQVIFVGDYVNRGPDSYGVMEVLAEQSSLWGERLVLLMGNHDASLLEFVETKSPSAFLRHGGLQTVNNYLRSLNVSIGANPLDDFLATFPQSHRDLLNSMQTYYETDEMLVSHSGFNPDEPDSRSIHDVTFGRHSSLFKEDLRTPRRIVVCGHYVQRTGSPYVSERFVCLDSGCGTVEGAPLSVLILPSRQVLSFTGKL